jgi:hypothetical protein
VGGLEEMAEEDLAEAAPLVAVHDDEGYLGDLGLVGRLVAGDGHQLGRLRGAPLHDEGEAAPVVHARMHACPVGRQPLHDGEEALVGAVLAQVLVHLVETRSVVGPDRSEAKLCAVGQHNSSLEFSGVL